MTFASLEIKGQALGEAELVQLNQQNMMRDIQQGNPELDRMIQLLDDLYVKDGVLVLVPKGSPLIVEEEAPQVMEEDEPVAEEAAESGV